MTAGSSVTITANVDGVEKAITFPVPDDTPLQPPKGATVYEDSRSANEFGSWRVVKYLAPNWRRALRQPRAKRRRR